MSEYERIANSGRLIVELARLTNCPGARVRAALYDAGFEEDILPSVNDATKLTEGLTPRSIPASRLQRTVAFHAIDTRFKDDTRGYVALTWHPPTSLLDHRVIPELKSNIYSKEMRLALRNGIAKIAKILDFADNDAENKRHAAKVKEANKGLPKEKQEKPRDRDHVRTPPSDLIDSVILVGRHDTDTRELEIETEAMSEKVLTDWQPGYKDFEVIDEELLPCSDVKEALLQLVGTHKNQPPMFDTASGSLDTAIPSPRMLAGLKQGEGRRSISVTREIPYGKKKPVPSPWERPEK